MFGKGLPEQQSRSLAERARLAWENSPLVRRPRLLISLARTLLAETSNHKPLSEIILDHLGPEQVGPAHTDPAHTGTTDKPAASSQKSHQFKKVWDLAAPWIVPALFLGLLPVGIIQLGAEKTLAAAGWWMAANAGLGLLVMLAIRAHPLTLLAAVTLGPLSALHPFIGSGFVCAWAEYRNRRPRWNDLKTLGSDLRSIRAWFGNRALRVMLAWVAGSIANLLSNIVGVWLAMRLLTA